MDIIIWKWRVYFHVVVQLPNILNVFAGQPKRHLLTTGWSVFVSAKRLVAGDAVLFIWYAVLSHV